MNKLWKYEGSSPFSASRIRTCGDLDTYLFGQVVYPPMGRFSRPCQDAFQLVAVQSGSINVQVGRAHYFLAPGEAMLQRPGQREIYRFSDKEETKHTWCQVSPDVLSREEKRVLSRAKGVQKVPASVNILVEEGLAVGYHGDTGTHIAMQTLARACLLRFGANACAMNRISCEIPLNPDFERALEVITSKFYELRSVQDVAQRVGSSVTKLQALFRQNGAESPSRMIWRLKAERAVQLLRSTGLSLGEIADHCGYANAFHLSRSIKTRTGKAPRYLRVQEWKQ